MKELNPTTARAAAALFIALSVGASLMSESIAATAPANDASRLSSQYSGWAGGKANADAIVNGLATGSSITLVTAGPGSTKQIAGFMPQSRMSPEEISAALAAAQKNLSRLGISHPTADQIQAALIGGEVTLASGRSRMVQGSVALRQPEASTSQVVSR